MTFPVRRGLNLSHWLSQNRNLHHDRDTYVTRDDFARVAGWGFDHVRLPVDEVQLYDEAGRRSPDTFGYLGQALGWAADTGLRVLVDLHILRSHYFMQVEEPALYNDPAEAERFADLWDDLSEFLQDQPNDRVAYELMNEPVAHDPAKWNRVFRGPLNTIRRREPDRTIVLGSNHFQITSTFDDLDVPEGDPELLLSFHFYAPMAITHYRASWAKLDRYAGPVHYPGLPVAEADLAGIEDDATRALLMKYNQPFDAGVMAATIEQPLRKREQTGLPLYCGEFGVRNLTPAPQRLAWARDAVATFEAHDIAWSWWDYQGNFGVYDRRTGAADEALIAVMTGADG